MAMKTEIRYLMSMTTKDTIAHTQDNDLTHSMVHYLLTIHKLKEEKGYARVTDIARDLGLTKGSVSTAITNLKKKNLVVEDENKFLSLSENGHHEVHGVLSTRTLMYYFFKDVLKIEDGTAHKDSCLVEHLLSGSTREALFDFMKTIAVNPAKLKLNTTLDLGSYKSHDDFMEAQEGDRYL